MEEKNENLSHPEFSGPLDPVGQDSALFPGPPARSLVPGHLQNVAYLGVQG